MRIKLNEIGLDCSAVDEHGNKLKRVRSIRVEASVGQYTKVVIEQTAMELDLDVPDSCVQVVKLCAQCKRVGTIAAYKSSQEMELL